jgi:dipeptidyl-peptidase-3
LLNYTDIDATKESQQSLLMHSGLKIILPSLPDIKREKVKGIAARVINIAMLGGDCYPVSPLGINLPNASWIRKDIGSKSVRLSNIAEAYDITSIREMVSLKNLLLIRLKLTG